MFRQDSEHKWHEENSTGDTLCGAVVSHFAPRTRTLGATALLCGVCFCGAPDINVPRNPADIGKTLPPTVDPVAVLTPAARSSDALWRPGSVDPSSVVAFASRVAGGGASVQGTQASTGTGKAGVKDDGAKRSGWSLLPMGAVGAVVDVLAFGRQKYAANGWQLVPDAEARYTDAVFRHLVAICSGETIDADSGCSHWAHVACNALFLIWFQQRRRADG